MRILVIAPSWVGDTMMSHSLYRALKKQHPTCRLDVMAPPWSHALLEKMPDVDHALTLPIGHGELALATRRQQGKLLQKNAYDQAIVTPNSFKSALIPFFAQIPKRTGWRGEMRYGLINDLRVLNKTDFPLMVERYAALAYDKATVRTAAQLPKPFLLPTLTVSTQAQQKVIDTFSLSPSQTWIAFCPGAEFGPAKRWPHYHYGALATALIAKGYAILLLGAAKDRAVGDAIEAELEIKDRTQCCNLAGKTSLAQAIELLSVCAAVVTNDSGLMHISAALDRPMVALFGPSSPQFTPPLSEKARVIRLIDGYLKIRKGQGELGYDQSLIDITPERVLSELNPLLSELT